MKTSQLKIAAMFLIIISALTILIIVGIRYSYFDVFTVEYILSFVVFSFFIIYHYKNNFILSLEIVFNLYGLLYSNYYIGQLIIGNSQVEPIYIKAMLLSHLSILVFNITFIISKKLHIRISLGSFISGNRDYNEKKLWTYTTALFTVALIAESYVLFYRIGLMSYFSASRASKSLMSSNYSILSFYKFIIPILAVVFLYIYFKYHGKHCLPLFCVAFGISVFNALIAASRTELLAIILPIICILYIFEKINNRQVVLIGVFGIILFGTWKALLGDRTFNISFDGELNTWYDIFKNVMSSSDFHFRYGVTYLDTVVNLVIPITKTVPLSEWYMKSFESYIYSIGGGRGFSGVLEAYLNFDILGNILVYGFYGWLFKQLKRETDLQIIVYLIIMISTHQFFRSESYSLWKNMMWFKLYPIIIIFLFSSTNRTAQIDRVAKFKV